MQTPDEPQQKPAIPLDDITGCIINAAMTLHSTFQSGLLESAYELLLARSLESYGLDVRRQVPVSFTYEGTEYPNAFRVDLLVNDTVVVEIKSVEHIRKIHRQQLLTYLRLMNLPVGLLINFGSDRLKNGLERMVNKLDPARSPLLRVNQLGESTL